MTSRSLETAERKLVVAYNAARAQYVDAYPERDVIVTCTYRSPEEQQALYAQGRSKPGQIVTMIDGVSQLSNHNHYPSRALDFAVLISGKLSWDPDVYRPMGKYAVSQGLVWGGNWKTFKDYPHIELPKETV